MVRQFVRGAFGKSVKKKKNTGQVAGDSFLIAHIISLCILSKIGSNLLSYLVLLALGSRDSVSSKPDVKSCLFLFLILRVQMIGEKFVTRAFFSYFSSQKKLRLLWYRLYDLTLTDAKCYNQSRVCERFEKLTEHMCTSDGVCCLCVCVCGSQWQGPVVVCALWS